MLMKINKTAKRMIMFMSVGCVCLLGACSGNDSSTSSSGGAGTSSTSGGSSSTSDAWYVQYKGNEVSDGDTITAYVNEQTSMLVAYDIEGSQISDVSYTSNNESVLSIDSTTGYITLNAAGSATVTASNDSDSQSFEFNVLSTEAANGAYSFATASYEEKANILGVLEKYAVDNYMTGLTIFSNGGYVCYNSDRYTPIPTNYVSGYGWGTRKEGVLSSELSKARGGRPTYYQICTTSLPAHANAMDASGSDVSDFADYFTTSYYATRLNATNDGYEWYPSLATDDRPVAVDDDGNIINSDLNSRWRIHLRSGEDAPVYRTASTATYEGTEISKFDKQKVALEDYLTPFKFMLTQYNGQYRGSELTDGTSGFVGAANYYNATTTDPGTGAVWNDDLWDMYMGDENGELADGSRGNIIVGKDDEGDYIEFNLLYPCTQFYAMYYLTSSLYSPLPQEFVELWGTKLGKKPTGYSPVDTMLTTGAYYIDEYSTTLVTVSRNDDFYEYKEGQNGEFILNDGYTSRKVYQIPGFQYNYISDSNMSEQAFTSGEVDSYSPSVATLTTTYNTDSGSTGSVNWRRYQTTGDSNFKLNINSCTQDEWDEKFGTNGSVTPHVSSDQWECKDYMSNEHFLNFLSYSLDRQTICESRGTIPTQDYFSDTYLIDPESGVSYNSTDAHKAVLADRYNSTYGYNVTAAKNELNQAFYDEGGIVDMAVNGELATENTGSGAGTASNPYLVTIDMYWMNPTDESDYGDVFDSIEEVFSAYINETFGSACYKLNIIQHAGTSDYNEVYDRMKEGLFDLGFGAISGGALNPINFMEVLKSDNSSGFTLNWGPDTSAVSDDIVYNGQTWSYDGLWQAADTVAAISDGEIANVETVSSGNTSYESLDSTAKSVTYRLSFETLINGGADKNSLVVSITNGSTSVTYSVDPADGTGELQLDLDSSNQAAIVITSGFNTLIEEDDDGNETESACSIVTVKVSYDLPEINSTSSSTTTLSTYYGITGSR